MRIVEESYLKRIVEKLNTYAAEHDAYSDLFSGIDSFAAEPLQDLSFRSDLSYFDQIEFILNVITSIVARPHISNKTEDVVIRSELASSISPETFQATMRDFSLWKSSGATMSPEYVHYHQNIDDLRIYENVFLVMLIKMISAELTKYADFYASLIDTFHGQSQLSLDENNVSVAIFRIRKLHKKIRYLQNTRFYREINKEPTTLRTVHPTNILLKDRLYNYCFKFYRSLVTYPDKAALMHDFSIYYCMMLMRSLKKAGFKVVGKTDKLHFDDNKCLSVPPLSFENSHYRAHFEVYGDNKGILFTIEHKLVTAPAAREATHLLLFSPQSSFADLTDEILHTEGFMSVEAISLWNMAYVDDVIRPVYRNPLSEQEVMDQWLSGKISDSRASSDLYREFCPSCKKSAVITDEESDICHCTACGSMFTFYTDEKSMENVWFLRLRRSDADDIARHFSGTQSV